jgi:MFS family permease
MESFLNSNRDIVRTGRIDTRRNLLAYFTDIHFFNLGTYFAPVTVVLVALAARLTDDNFLIGLISPAWGAGWALPQLIAARLVHAKPRMKPYVVIPGLIGRQTFLIVALWLYFTKAENAVLTVWLLIAAVLVFAVADALATVAWFDMMSRNITARNRSRLFAISQFAASIFGVSIGLFVITPIFSDSGLPFPMNYTFAIGMAWVCFFVSWMGVNFVREEDGEILTHPENVETPHFGRLIWTALRHDKVMLRVLLARLFTAFEFMVATFYIVFIQQRLNLPDSSTATLNIALTIGSLIGLAGLGWVADRFGAHLVTKFASFTQCATPILAFIVATFPVIADTSPNLAIGIFVVVMALNGIVGHSLVLGFLNYILEIAQPTHRAVYIGIFNTMHGLMALTPPLAGVFINIMSPLLSFNTTYSILFGVVAILVAIGFAFSLRLPKSSSAP